MIDLRKLKSKTAQASHEEVFVEISPDELDELIALTERLQSELTAERAAERPAPASTGVTEMANAARAVWKSYYKIPQGVTWEPPSAALFMKLYQAMHAAARPAVVLSAELAFNNWKATLPSEHNARTGYEFGDHYSHEGFMAGFAAAQPAPAAPDAQTIALRVALDALSRSEPMYSRQFSQQDRKAQHIAAMDQVRAALAAAQPEAKAAPAPATLSNEQIIDIMSEHVNCDGQQAIAFARAVLAAAGNSQGQVAQPEQQPVAHRAATIHVSEFPTVRPVVMYCSLPNGTHDLFAAPVPAAAPEPLQGWKLVPVEPTRAMLEEIHIDQNFTVTAMQRRYAAMLAAAPAAPVGGKDA